MAAVDKRMPIIGLGNPGHLHPTPGILRFEVIPQDWIQTVREILSGTRCIFLHLTVFSDGILKEIELIGESKLHTETVVVISSRLASEETQHGAEIKNFLQDFKYIVFEKKHRWGRKKADLRLTVAKFTDEILSREPAA